MITWYTKIIISLWAKYWLCIHEDSRVWCLAATTADLTLALCASREPRRFTADVRRCYPPAAGRASSTDHEHRAHSRSHRSRERVRPYRWLRRTRALRHPGRVASYPHRFPYLVTGKPPVHIAPPVGWVCAKE